MTLWVDCFDQQPPYDLGILDDNQRSVWVFNIQAFKHPSDTFIREILRLLTDASVATLDTDMFATAKSVLPSGPGPYVVVNSTGGLTGIRTHNVTTGPAYEQSTAQVRVHALSAEAAEAKSREAYAALVGVRNQDITPL